MPLIFRGGGDCTKVDWTLPGPDDRELVVRRVRGALAAADHAAPAPPHRALSSFFASETAWLAALEGAGSHAVFHGDSGGNKGTKWPFGETPPLTGLQKAGLGSIRSCPAACSTPASLHA
jgi:hypothetical protein